MYSKGRKLNNYKPIDEESKTMDIIYGPNETKSEVKTNTSKALNCDLIYGFYNDYWINQKEFNQIESRLYLGSDSVVKNKNLMENLGINCVITVKEDPIPAEQKLKDITYIHLEAGDFPDEDLLSHFDNCFKWITGAQNQAIDHTVYVHCGSGVSRSATIVIAFIMKKYKISFLDAIKRVNKKRKVFPNEGFTEQLKLYERMSFFTDGYNKEYRKFLLKTLTYKLRTDCVTQMPTTFSLMKTTTIDEKEKKSFYEKIFVGNYFEKISFAEQMSEMNGQRVKKGITYCCYVCKTELFSENNIIGDQLLGERCEHIFIEPLQTYCTQKFTDKTGSLKCPNCLSRFGIYNWLLYDCECDSHREWRECLALKVSSNKLSLKQIKP